MKFILLRKGANTNRGRNAARIIYKNKNGLKDTLAHLTNMFYEYSSPCLTKEKMARN